MMDILLDKKSGPLGIVIDLVSKKIIKMRRVTVAYPQPDSATRQCCNGRNATQC